MPFAFKLFFGEESARPVRRIWEDLARSGFSSFLKDSGSTPGVTLGIFDAGEENGIVGLARIFAERHRAFPVSSWGLGNFPTDPAQVFLGITLSPELQAMHAEFIRSATGVGEISAYYQPGNWIPHSTLALRCRIADVAEITRLCLMHETRRDFLLRSIAVVEIGTARVAAEFDLLPVSGR